MQRDTVRQKAFSRRALMFSGGAAALTTVLVGRLYYLQVVSADRYRVLADENRDFLAPVATAPGDASWIASASSWPIISATIGSCSFPSKRPLSTRPWRC